MTSRVSYAFGAFGNDMFFATLSTYFIMFVTTQWRKFKPWVVVGGTVGSVALIILFTNMGGLNKVDCKIKPNT